MAAGDTKCTYGASVALTITLASVATSSTWVAGAEAAPVDNSSVGSQDHLLSGRITVGTTPTANTYIEVWVVPRMDDTVWPDVFDGTASAETVTTRDQLLSYGKLAARMKVPATTSNVGYDFSNVSVASLFGWFLPKAYTVFVTHNTGVNLNSTGGNHFITYTPVATNTALS